jgi:hypothetical protein
MKNNSAVIFTSITLMLLYTTTIYADIVWPALFVGGAIFSAWSLSVVSIAIEGLMFHFFITDITYGEAFLMSCIGNAASVIIGTILMVITMALAWHSFFDQFLGGTFHIVNWVATYILMYLGSCFIELITLRIIFRYTIKQLLIPSLVGNFLTYILAAAYHIITKFNA